MFNILIMSKRQAKRFFGDELKACWSGIAEGIQKTEEKANTTKTAAQRNLKSLNEIVVWPKWNALTIDERAERKESTEHSQPEKNVKEKKINKTSNDETLFFMSEYDKSKIAGKRQIAKNALHISIQ